MRRGRKSICWIGATALTGGGGTNWNSTVDDPIVILPRWSSDSGIIATSPDRVTAGSLNIDLSATAAFFDAPPPCCEILPTI